MWLEHIKKRQKQLERKRRREAKLEAEKEAARVAKMEAEAREQEEIAARKKRLLEQQQDERFRQKHIQRKEKLTEQKWDNQLDILLAQIKDRFQKDDKLKEIRNIIQNREPSLQELDWANWLSNPLNQKLADLDFDYATEMFKRDNLMAKRLKPQRRRSVRGKGRKTYPNYALVFDRANEEYVTTEFDPIDYNLNQGFTVSFWVRPDELGGHRFAMGRRRAAANGRFTFGLRNNTNLFVGVGNTKKTGFAHGMEEDIWYHLVITYAGNSASPKTLKAYVDGEEIMDTTTSWPDADNENGIPIYFGARNAIAVEGYNLGWSCGLDQVAIFDEVKDANWVANVYNTGQKKLDLSGQSGLVGYWKFDEGGGTTVTDYSGNGNHGTFAPISGDTTAYPTWETLD